MRALEEVVVIVDVVIVHMGGHQVLHIAGDLALIMVGLEVLFMIAIMVLLMTGARVLSTGGTGVLSMAVADIAGSDYSRYCCLPVLYLFFRSFFCEPIVTCFKLYIFLVHN